MKGAPPGKIPLLGGRFAFFPAFPVSAPDEKYTYPENGPKSAEPGRKGTDPMRKIFAPWSDLAGWMDRSIDGLIESEYDNGIDSVSPDLFVDLCLNPDSTERQSYDAFDVSKKKYMEVPPQGLGLLGDRYRRIALILPPGAVISKLVCFRKERDPAEAIREKVNFDLSSSIYNVAFCGDEGDYRYLYVSIIPQKTYTALNDRMRPIIKSGASIIRAYDRLIPMTRFVASRMEVNESVFCIEQRGDYLTIWNVTRAGKAVVPVNSSNFRIPAINPPRSIEGKIMTMKNEYMRIYKFLAPKKMFIVSNGEPMVAGVLSMEELTQICVEASKSQMVGSAKNRNASIEGSVLLER